MLLIRFLTIAGLFASSLAVAKTARQSVPRLDPVLDALVSPGADVEIVKGGY